jgi:hypothetical protein
MRVIDLLEKPNGKFAAAMVKWDAAGGRSENFILSGSQLPELLSARGMRLQTLNILPGSNWHTGVIVNNVNAQSARMADYLAANTQGQIGAFLSRIGGEVIVNLRGDRPFYPCSAIKVLIHVHGISRVPAADLNRYTIDNVLLRTWASKMMMDSDNPSTYKLNKHWGTDKINAYGRSHLGMTSATYIKDHYGIAPPDGKENAWATLVDMANLYSKLGVVGAERQDELKSWMLNDTNSGMFDGEFSAARQKLGLNSTQYSTWRQKVKFQFKAGNLVHPNDSKSSSDFVVNGKIMLPYRIGSMAQLRSYAFGYFVNKSPQPYKSDVAWKAASMLLREQIEDSMKTYK